jgi:hypothetical protein
VLFRSILTVRSELGDLLVDDRELQREGVDGLDVREDDTHDRLRR